MADQIPKIKSKQLVLQLKPPRFCLQSLMVGLFMLALSIYCVQTATCPSSVPFSATTIIEECSYSGFTTTRSYGVAVGPVSSSLYYLVRITTPSDSAAVRKVDASGSQTWMASFAFYPILKSLSVDAAEQSVYLASLVNPIVVIKLAASDGTIATQHEL